MEALFQDVRYALRTLRKSPLFLIIVVLTLALGIGANVAIFTLVNAVLLRPLPFPDPDRLVRVFDDLSGAGAKDVGTSVPELEDLRHNPELFEQVSTIWPVSTALSGGDRVERIEMLGTSPSYFEILGAHAALGTVYKQSDWVPGFLDGVVISDGLWKRQFGSDPHVIGRRIRVDEDGYTIIGVMPPDFRHPGETLEGDVEIWAAAGFLAPPAPTPPVRGIRLFPGALARLKPGLTLGQAQKRLDAFVARLQETYPNDYPQQLRWSLRLEPAQASLTGNLLPAGVPPRSASDVRWNHSRLSRFDRRDAPDVQLAVRCVRGGSVHVHDCPGASRDCRNRRVLHAREACHSGFSRGNSALLIGTRGPRWRYSMLSPPHTTPGRSAPVIRP